MAQERKRDDARIDVEQEQELKYWADLFGVSREEIREAVKAVGQMVRDVRHRLGVNRSH